jgi:hypothetical protein
MHMRINDERCAHSLGRFQITACADFLWRLINAVFDFARMNKMIAQVWDMLEKNGFMTERDVIEQNEVLMQLTHVTDVRHDGSAELA